MPNNTKIARADFLLELGCEELPPKLLTNLAQQLKDNLAKQLVNNNISFNNINEFCTPRRLAVLVSGLQTIQEAKEITKKGPSLLSPAVAINGFATSCGVAVADLAVTDINGTEYYVFISKQQAKTSAKLLLDIIPNVITSIKINRPMSWGMGDYSFARPVHWLVALLGKDIVPISVFGLDSNRQTYGLRTTKTAININNACDYQQVMADVGIQVNFNDRKQLIKKQIDLLVANKNLVVSINDDLLDEVCALVEAPQAFIASFAKEFLELPSEVLILTIEAHQKYFPVFDNNNKLQSLFIAVANTREQEISTIIAGNQRVISPRLADAAFFYQQDKKITLEDRLKMLKSVLFMQSLGSLYDKVNRLVELATYLIDELACDNKPQIIRAVQLSKSDLVANIVIELPKLQGVMGGYYALNDGEDEMVADIISQQYLPRYSGDNLPTSATTSLLAIVDKIDTIVGIYALGKIPTGSKDPYALRRLAIGIARIIINAKLQINITELISKSLSLYQHLFTTTDDTRDNIMAFIMERLKVYYLEQGFSVNVYNGVVLNANNSIYDFNKRIVAIKEFTKQIQAQNLITLNKRIINTLKDSSTIKLTKKHITLLTTTEEQLLLNTVNDIDTTKYKTYSEKILDFCKLEPVIDNFFAKVMVNVDNKELKNARIALLFKIKELFLSIVDISKL